MSHQSRAINVRVATSAPTILQQAPSILCSIYALAAKPEHLHLPNLKCGWIMARPNV